MEPLALAQNLIALISGIYFVWGLIYFVSVRVLSVGSKKEILTSLTVMAVSAIVFALTI